MKILVMGSFNERNNSNVGRMSPASIRAEALEPDLGRLFTLPLGG